MSGIRGWLHLLGQFGQLRALRRVSPCTGIEGMSVMAGAGWSGEL